MPQSIGGSLIYRVRILFPLRLNLLQINHQVQILINVNGPVVTVKVPVIAPFHNTPARSRSNIQFHALLIVGCLHASRHAKCHAFQENRNAALRNKNQKQP